MFDFSKNRRRYKMRDINVAIDYHNTGETLKSIGKKYNMNRERVRQIHAVSIRHVLGQLGKYHCEAYSKKCHCEETARHLKEYKEFLLTNGVAP